MNKRIRELADEARIKDHWSIDEGRYLTNYLDEQKFAQLIVEECAWLVDQNDISLPYGTFGKLIKGHFGVEE